MAEGITWQVVLVHLLCYPIYQILGSVRHELSHWIAARLSGVGVLAVKVIPHRYEGEWYWGRIQYDIEDYDRFNTHIPLAPYYVVALHVVVFLSLYVSGTLHKVSTPHWNMFVWAMFFISPITDFFYNILKYTTSGTGDFADAVQIGSIGK